LSERFATLPFIIYTSTFESPGDEKLALSFGADRFLRRPAPAKELLTAIRDVTDETKPRRILSLPPPEALEVVQKYSVKLVRKLEERNDELAQAHAKTLAVHQTLVKRTEELERSEAKFRSIF